MYQLQYKGEITRKNNRIFSHRNGVFCQKLSPRCTNIEVLQINPLDKSQKQQTDMSALFSSFYSVR